MGGGWAGCAAAVELSSSGCEVTLFEASGTLGGRARAVDLNGQALDNGQHILLGAYTETLRLMKRVGIDPAAALLRLPLQMRYPDVRQGMRFVAPRLPAPLHLVSALLLARGLGLEDRLSLARFSTTARWMEWRLHVDCSVAELLDRFDQTDRLIRLMWRPLCIAALNTPPERASAQIFLNVLRDSLGARRAASDMLLPRVDLSRLFPARAAACIEAHGGSVATGTAVKTISPEDGGWRIETARDAGLFDAVVVAVQPDRAAALLAGRADTGLLSGFAYEPITTCYLQYAPAVGLDHPFLALVDDAQGGDWGQFVFDRGRLNDGQAGLLAVVISASAPALESGHATLEKAVAAQLAAAFDRPELAHPLWTRTISEKRATFSCTPGLRRPPTDIGLPGLALAGDYVESDYPATLESAVRSGVQAARRIAG